MTPAELAHLILQLAVLLLVAKLFGILFKKMKQSEVLGELIGGMAIGPFALGGVDLPFIGALFGHASEHGSGLAISPELYFFGQIGAVLLLFLVGLETDAKMFMKYGLKSLGIAIGGVVVPFFLGAWGTMAFGFADSIFDGPALFMGAIMTATSVGITARVLSDMYKLDTREGVSILAAAVIDDILGILVLAVVLSLAGQDGGEGVSLSELGMIGLKAVGFIGVVSVIGIMFGKKLSHYLLKLDGKTYAAIAAAICFLIAAIAEMFGLATIIGAYLAGILLSVTPLGKELEEKLAGASHLVVPVFFAIMGTLVDFRAMASAIVFGLVITAFAIIGKVVGCGIPAFFSGFNFMGSSRIGIGMLPRGEVALIVAGIGLSAGLISNEVFGVSIMMTVVTTLLAPIILVPLFKNPASGVRGEETVMVPQLIEPYRTLRQSPHMVSALRDFLVEAFQARGYDVELDDRVRGIANLIGKDDDQKIITLRMTKGELSFDCSTPSTADVDAAITDGLTHFQEAIAGLQTV